MLSIFYVKDTNYNAKGQIEIIKYGNGVMTNYTYGQDLRLSQILTQNASGMALQDLNYLFDKNGNVTTLTDNLRSNIRTYTYDDLDRLIRANNSPSPSGGHTNFIFQYDSIGNMTYKSDIGVMQYPSAGQTRPHAVTYAGGYSYQYDANGNMTSGKHKIMSYDIENRLIQVNELGKISTFAYDGDGGRVLKTSPTASGQSVTTAYIGSFFEKDSSGKVTKHIFAGANRVASSLLASPQAGEAISYFHSDHLGSSNVITDQAGNQIQYCEYTPYGELAKNVVIASPEGAKQSPANYLFTGKELDSTGLYFYGARYYDPVIGRFITADTIVQAPYDPQSLNRYSYCRNNPINYVDPSGHSWFSKFFKRWAGVIGIAFGLVGLLIASAITGNWQPFQNIAAATTIGFVTGGPIGATTAMFTSSFLDTDAGREAVTWTANEVFDDIFGMSSRAAYMVSNIFVSAVVSSAIYLGLNNSSNVFCDYTNSANRSSIEKYASDVSKGRGGSSANYIGRQVGKNPVAKTSWYSQGRVSSEIAFQKTPVVNKVLNALQIRHSAAVVNAGGILRDSAQDIALLDLSKGQIWGAPWTGVCHQATVRTLIEGGMSGLQAVQATASQVGWSFYLSSSIYGIDGHSAMTGIINAELNNR